MARRWGDRSVARSAEKNKRGYRLTTTRKEFARIQRVCSDICHAELTMILTTGQLSAFIHFWKGSSSKGEAK